MDLSELEGWPRRACRPPEDVDPAAWVKRWFPLSYSNHGRPVPAVDAAVTICMGCPIQADCLLANLEELEGIFGGATPYERWKIRNGQHPAYQLALA